MFDYDKEITEQRETIQEVAYNYCSDLSDEELLQEYIDRRVQLNADLRDRLIDGLYDIIADDWGSR